MIPIRARLAAALAVAVLAVGAACAPPGPDAVVIGRAPGPTSPGGTDGPDAPDDPRDPGQAGHLSPWEPCQDAYQCATLTVPLDWADPDGDTIGLAVIRRPAPGDAIGSLVTNPGGPGASGVDFLPTLVGLGRTSLLADRFDLVSWDPRGTGRSAPIRCTDDEDFLEPDLDPIPDDQADIDALRAEAEEATAACLRAAGDRLPLVGTRATVRDLDALRAALGDERLTYVGFSYGTTIGLEYLRLHPDRVRAMVLDGVSLPGVDPIADTYRQAQGFERTLDAYLDDCANRPSCPLGGDPRADLLALLARLEHERIPASYALGAGAARQGTLGVGELYIAIGASLYARESWVILDQALGEALGSPPIGRTALALRDSYLGRQIDGTWEATIDARRAISCADQEERSATPEGDLSLGEQWAREMPVYGEWFAAGLPGCWGLPDAVDPLRPLEEGAIRGTPPVVLIGATQDPATPYEQAQDARRIVPGSVLVTWEGANHTIYLQRSSCIDDPVTAYLVDTTVPPDGLRCSP